ncbi:MAG: transposase [Phaeodactylibacter sp.]|nr:transposase [Phaeodactylibacter sp.]
MAQSLAQVYLHSVFSTKYRQNLIIPEVESQLYAYIGGIINNLGGRPLIINGVPDHVPILSTLPRTVTIAKYLEEIKKNSSKWVKSQSPDLNLFAWQNGYAAFSVSSSRIGAVTNYIKKQKEHHKRLTFKEEVIRLATRLTLDRDCRGCTMYGSNGGQGCVRCTRPPLAVQGRSVHRTKPLPLTSPYIVHLCCPAIEG